MTNKADTGIVVSASRRHVSVITKHNKIIKGTCSSKTLDISVGDNVEYQLKSKGSVFVDRIFDRKNILKRSFNGKSKNIAANLDRLFIVTATTPLFNTHFINRILSAAYVEGVEVTLIVNKIDENFEETKELIDIYTSLNIDVICCSAKCQTNIPQIEQILEDKDLQIIALAGVSGVGKSTLLNCLIPEADRKTQEVSIKTGQGKQTTTQSFAYTYEKTNESRLLIVDLPGVQSFGITHLTKEEVKASFEEFTHFHHNCEFLDCSHISEPTCGVKKALDDNLISQSRYNSYLDMLDEIEQAKTY